MSTITENIKQVDAHMWKRYLDLDKEHELSNKSLQEDIHNLLDLVLKAIPESESVADYSFLLKTFIRWKNLLLTEWNIVSEKSLPIEIPKFLGKDKKESEKEQ